ncbi:MAG: hypothetical protein WBQ23_13540 [Bacteroidota bacterium]
MNQTDIPQLLSPRQKRGLTILAMTGLLAFIAGLFLAPEHAWSGLLVTGWYVLGLGVAGLCFLAFTAVTNAGWSAAIKRVPEAMTAVLPFGIVFVLLFSFGVHSVYEWSHESLLKTDTLLAGKSSWLNTGFFIGRGVAIVAIWSLLAWRILHHSLQQDEDRKLSHSAAIVRLGALTMVVVGVTYCLASFDWIMSLEPHWFSTIFGFYNLAGMFLSGMAMLTILVIVLRRNGALSAVVSDEHLQDLGKILFAASTFWMYLWFSQYMLIWYSNIPEETSYFILREQGGWLTFTVLNVLFNWILPFAGLISSRAKRNEGLLFKMCILLLVGRWIDISWMVMPPLTPDGPMLTVWDVLPLAGGIAVFLLLVSWRWNRAPAVPLHDPMLVESLHYHS